ncbi:MAG TPA: glycosyltransferase family 39 protein [Patescibacteria group bacterium]|nr:glycosyltransferase family 39 protein [Patescibacteria group bacterium]
MKKQIGFIIIVLFAAVMRLWHLDSLSYGFANDEISYIYSSYTIWKTSGHDISGKFLPLSINLDSSLSPTPVYIGAPFVGIFGLSPFTGRLPFALAGIGSVILVYLLADLLFQNKMIASLSGFVMVFSPWNTVINRGAWDGNMGVFFYLLGTYLLLKGLRKGTILWSIPAFLLAFYSYHAMKVFLVSFVPILIFLYYKQLLQRKQQLFLFIFLCFTILASFFLVTITQGVSREEVLAWKDPKNIEQVTKQVNYFREKSSAPTLLKDIVTNKVTILASSMIDNYLGAFSMQHLFITGDISPVYTYGIFFKGVLYIIEFPLLLFGIIFLAKKTSKQTALTVAAGLFCAPLSSAIGSGTTYIIRALLMVPFFSIIIGSGIFYAFEISKKNKILFLITTATIIIGYVVCIGLFLYRYLFQFNGAGNEFWNASSRTVATEIKENYAMYDHVYVSGSDDKFLLQFVFWNQIDPNLFQKVWQTGGVRKIGKVTFLPDCIAGIGDPHAFLPKKSLYLIRSTCTINAAPDETITDRLEPLQVLWRIYEKK